MPEKANDMNTPEANRARVERLHQCLQQGLNPYGGSADPEFFRQQFLVDLGSGSCKKDSPIAIIAMKKEQEASLMHDHRFGKGERHAHKTSETLSQGVIPPLDDGTSSCRDQ